MRKIEVNPLMIQWMHHPEFDPLTERIMLDSAKKLMVETGRTDLTGVGAACSALLVLHAIEEAMLAHGGASSSARLLYEAIGVSFAGIKGDDDHPRYKDAIAQVHRVVSTNLSFHKAYAKMCRLTLEPQ